MSSNETRNWFADESVAQDPYPFLAALRSQCPVQPTPHHDVIAVTGYEETSEILRRHDAFSACVTVVARSPISLSPWSATTSANSSTGTATGCRSTSTW